MITDEIVKIHTSASVAVKSNHKVKEKVVKIWDIKRNSTMEKTGRKKKYGVKKDKENSC